MRNHALALALAASSLTAPALAQTAAMASATVAKAPFVKAEAEAVVRELATQLDENFVFPDAAKAYAAMLRSNLEAGKYAAFADSDAFAEAVTADLQAVHKDGHLRLRAPRQEGGKTAAPRREPPPGFKFIPKSGWLADGVAYIVFEAFPGDEATLAELRTFLEAHKDAKSLIIDARGHHGGGLEEMDVMFAQLFGTETRLVGMDTRIAVEERRKTPLAGLATLRVAKGPEGVVRREHWVKPAARATALRNAKVYLLTSGKTVSAGEHLALALKRTRRATLIGETTRGAGHYGGLVELGHGYTAFIPVGRTFDPDTGQGWEGTGVAPDIAVPADKALDEALRLVGVKTSEQAALAKLD